MTLTKPAGCFLQLVALAVLFGGVVSCINVISENRGTPVLGTLLVIFAVLLGYLGGRPGKEAAQARKRAARQ